MSGAEIRAVWLIPRACGSEMANPFLSGGLEQRTPSLEGKSKFANRPI